MNQSTELGSLSWRQAAWIGMLALVVSAFLVPTESNAEHGLDFPRTILTLVLTGSVLLTEYWLDRHRSDLQATRPRWQWVDGAVAVFMIWHTISCLVAIYGHTGEPGPASHLMWQQITIGLLYFLARKLWWSPSLDGLAIRVLVAAGLMVCCLGFYQFLVELPGLQQQYQDAPESVKVQMLQQAGVTEWEPGARMRQLFESRLFNHEPFAFFTLANSLAGLLVPLVLASYVCGWNAMAERRWPTAGFWGLAWGILLATLVLTSSRTGLLSVTLLMGGYALARWLRWEGGRWGWLLPASCLGLPLVGAVAMWATGFSDGRLFSSAPASVRYRLEYWLSTCQMIWDHFWLGCHPGSFQSNYARYQLATASETVSDPHQFLLEWTATAGVPAGIAILAAIVATLWMSAAKRQAAGQDGAESNVVPMKPGDQADAETLLHWLSPTALLLGCIVAWVSAWLYGLGIAASGGAAEFVWIVGLVIAGLWLLGSVVWAMGRVSLGACAPLGAGAESAAIGLAWMGLMVHLLASGGANYPAIGQLFFLLMAILVNRSQSLPPDDVRPVGTWQVALGSLVLGIAGYLYLFQLTPAIKSISLMSRAGEQLERGNAFAAVPLLRGVLNSDPDNSQAAFLLATVELMKSQHQLGTLQVQEQVVRAFEQAMRLEPASAPARKATATQMIQALPERSSVSEDAARRFLLQQADRWLQAAIECKPVDAEAWMMRSWIQWVAGDQAASRVSAGMAMDLDQQFVHSDMKLQGMHLYLDPVSAQQLSQQGAPVSRREDGSWRVNARDWLEWLNSGR